MGIQMTATVKNDNNQNIAAPFQAFAKNTNVIAYNNFVKAPFQDKEFKAMYLLNEEEPDLAPTMTMTFARKQLINTLLTINFYGEPVHIFSSNEVKAFAEKLQEYKETNSYRTRSTYGIEYNDFLSTIEFFDICAANGYGVSFA